MLNDVWLHLHQSLLITHVDTPPAEIHVPPELPVVSPLEDVIHEVNPTASRTQVGPTVTHAAPSSPLTMAFEDEHPSTAPVDHHHVNPTAEDAHDGGVAAAIADNTQMIEDTPDDAHISFQELSGDLEDSLVPI